MKFTKSLPRAGTAILCRVMEIDKENLRLNLTSLESKVHNCSDELEIYDKLHATDNYLQVDEDKERLQAQSSWFSLIQ